MEWNWGSDERPWVYYGGLFWGKQVLLHIRWYAAPVYWELCYGFAVGLRGMNLESGNFKAMTRLGNEVCRMMQLKDEGILILEVLHVKLTNWYWVEYWDVLKPWVTGYWKPSTETMLIFGRKFSCNMLVYLKNFSDVYFLFHFFNGLEIYISSPVLIIQKLDFKKNYFVNF